MEIYDLESLFYKKEININKIYTIPRMGIYTDFFVKALKDLGINIISPPDITNETNKIGIRNSVEMQCFPAKSTLGSLIKAVKIDKITDIITYSTEGSCRFRHYGKLYELALKNLGYNINVHIIRKGHIFRDLKKITGVSYWKIWKTFRRTIKKINRYEKLQENLYYNPDRINILLIGEIYTLLEPKVNFNIRKRLYNLDIGSKLTVTLSSFIEDNIQGKKLQLKEADKYFNGEVGGHGKQGVIRLLENINNIEGVIHVLPLTCMPECLAMPVIEYICRQNKIPLLKVEIDDNASELNIQTRLEAFTEMIKRKEGRLK